MMWPRSLFVGLLLAVLVLVPPARAAWGDALAAYEDGRFEEALAQLLPLAEADNVEAQEIVADIYIYGQGVEIDPQEALKWSRRAAALGSAEGENDIAVHYAKGQGVEQDDAEALKWFERAAEHGNAKALISLSRRYLYGTDGLEPDFGRGLAYLFAAADSGHPRALWSLAQFTETGRFGLSPDLHEALRLYERAAELRYPAAQVELAYAYATGRGVVRDRLRATMWLAIAAKARCIRAAQIYERWAVRGLTRSEVEAAGRMAEDWESSHPPLSRRNANDVQSGTSCQPFTQFGAITI